MTFSGHVCNTTKGEMSFAGFLSFPGGGLCSLFAFLVLLVLQIDILKCSSICCPLELHILHHQGYTEIHAGTRGAVTHTSNSMHVKLNTYIHSTLTHSCTHSACTLLILHAPSHTLHFHCPDADKLFCSITSTLWRWSVIMRVLLER